MELSRREFLKLSAVGTAAFVASRFFPIGPVDDDKKKEVVGDRKTDTLDEFLSKRVPRAFQADCLPGMSIFVAGDFISWESLASSGNENQLERIGQMNGVKISKPEDFIEKGRVLLVPAGIGRYSNKETIASNLYNRLETKVVADPLVAEERQFLPVELRRLNEMLSDWVMPYLDRFAPEGATMGMILITRAPNSLSASYAKETEHIGVARLDYFTAGDNAFSHYRDKDGRMVLTNTVDGKIYGRRIYLLKELPLDLREKMVVGNFLTSPEWAGYYLNNMWGMAHEILHLIVTSEYNFPPFDNHSFVRSLSLACVLEFRRGRKKEWDKGPISDELWLKPELQVLKVYPDFYKDLFEKLRGGRAIETIKFDEKEVYQKSEDLFTRKGLGSFSKRWGEWKRKYEKVVEGRSQEQRELAIDFNKLAYEL